MSRKSTVLLLLTGLLALIAALSISQYPARQAADLRRQIAADRDLEFDKRAQLEATLLQYETDNRIKIWTAIVQAAGGAAILTAPARSRGFSSSRGPSSHPLAEACFSVTTEAGHR